MGKITKTRLLVDSCANVNPRRVHRDIVLIEERQIHEDYEGNYYRFALRKIDTKHNTWECCKEILPHEEVI